LAALELHCIGVVTPPPSVIAHERIRPRRELVGVADRDGFTCARGPAVSHVVRKLLGHALARGENDEYGHSSGGGTGGCLFAGSSGSIIACDTFCAVGQGHAPTTTSPRTPSQDRQNARSRLSERPTTCGLAWDACSRD